MRNWFRKVYRVFWDFPMYWQPWGWKHSDMRHAYWDGHDLGNEPCSKGLHFEK